MTSTSTPNGAPRGRIAFRARPALREHRELARPSRSLRQMADQLDISVSHVCVVELGRRNASPALADRWAQALEADRDALFEPVRTRSDA